MHRKPFRLLLMLLALAIALVARQLLDGSLPAQWTDRWPILQSLGLSTGLLGGALLLFGLVTAGQGPASSRRRFARPSALSPPSEPDARIVRPAWLSEKQPERSRQNRSTQVSTVLLLASAACYSASLAVWNTQGESILVHISWLSGIALLLLSQANLLAIPAMLRSMAETVRSRVMMVELFQLAAILVAAFGLRFYRLEVLPFDMHGDMASHAFQARELIYSEQQTLWTVGYGEVPMLGYLPMALSLRFFGDNLFGFRISAVLEGTLSVLGIYLLARELFGRRVASLSALLLTVSYAHIHFSRVGQFMDVLPWIVFALYSLVRGVQRRSHFSFAAGGVLIGLGLQMYYASRILLVLVPLFLVWRWIVARRASGPWLPSLLLLLLGALLAFGPMLPFSVQNPTALVGRSQVVSLLNPAVMTHLKGKYGVDSGLEVLLEQAKRSLLTFYRYGDASTHFSLQEPFVSPLVAALLTLGLGYVLFRPRRMGTLLVTSWLLLTLTLGSILTNDAPTWPHIVSILLPVMTLAALAADRLWTEVETVFVRAGSITFLAVAFSVMLLVGVTNWRLYIDHASDNARPRTRIGRYLAEAPGTTQFFLVEDPFYSRDRELRFLVGQGQVLDLREDEMWAGSLPKLSGPAIFVVTPNHASVLDLLERAYPAGASREHREASGHLAFITFEVP